MTFELKVNYDPKRARATLARRDPALAALFRAVGPFAPVARRERTTFEHLLRAIVYQQVSTRAAETVHGRLLDLFEKRRPSAARLLATDDATLRAVGLSGVKVRYLRALGTAVRTRALPSRRKLDALDDAAVIDVLTGINGIGRWTVEVLLIFHLGRADVMPSTDLGVRRGYGYLLGTEPPAATVLAAHAQRCWRPYRSFAAWYLWQANYLEPAAVAALAARTQSSPGARP